MPSLSLDQFLLRIAPFGRLQVYARGEQIHHRGDAGAHLSVLIAGSVVLSNVGRRGRRITNSVLERGDFYGVYVVFEGGRRTQDAHAHRDASVLQVPRAALRRLFDVDPEVRDFFIARLAVAIEKSIEALDDERRLPLTVRLGKLLLRRSRATQGRVEATQADLAQQLAVSRYALGTGLAGLAALGFVKTGYGRIDVTDRRALRAWVEARAELAQPG